MSVARCREINARLRAAGITVHEYPGCWTRGNGQSPAYEGGIVHHTASAFGMALSGTGIGRLLADGRSDLSGPLCNWAGNIDGSLTFVAAFPANHAGASGGRSMGPLPTTRLFNPRVLGLEIVYPGSEPMRTAQYRSGLVWSRITTDVCGYSNIERARAHAETSITGKWDPGQAPGVTINMAAFRAAARSIQEDELSARAEKLIADIHEIVVSGYTRTGALNKDLGYIKDTLGKQIASVQGAISTSEARVLAALPSATGGTVDVAALADALAGELGPDIGEALVDALAAQLNRNREGN